MQGSFLCGYGQIFNNFNSNQRRHKEVTEKSNQWITVLQSDILEMRTNISLVHATCLRSSLKEKLELCIEKYADISIFYSYILKLH